MVKRILYFFSLMALLCTLVECDEKKIEIEEKEEAPSNAEDNLATLPKDDTESWYYVKNKTTGKKEKFFGIGFWHVPGYELLTMPGDEANANSYKKRTAYCNIVFMDPRYHQSFMHEKRQMVSNFSAELHNYLDQISFLPKGLDKDYYRTQYLKANVNTPQFEQMLDNAVRKLMQQTQSFDRVYAPIDEIALGGIARWYIPPSVGDKMYEIIKKKEGDPLVFVDLVGHGRGSTFFFEQNYLKKHSVMPGTPPYELLSDEARANKTIPLLGFYEAYDGTPVYEFDSNGNYSYNRSIGWNTYKNMWYQNLKIISSAYKNNGNVFSINAFRDFYAYPVLAGVTVDAMREGLGDCPIWLYFDGNGYAKPAALSPVEYMKVVECQIYKSIIHGATGIFFWNDWSKTPEVFDALQPVLKELNERVEIVYLKTVDRKVKDHLHIMIKQNEKGKRFIIATNTNKLSDIGLNVKGIAKNKLKPLEVYVAEIP